MNRESMFGDRSATAVPGAIDPVADRQIRARQPLAARHVDDVGIGGRHGNRPDRLRRLLVEYRPPGAARVIRLPDAAIHRAHIEDARLRCHAGHRPGTAAAHRADHAPAEIGEHPWSGVLCRRALREQRETDEARERS